MRVRLGFTYRGPGRICVYETASGPIFRTQPEWWRRGYNGRQADSV